MGGRFGDARGAVEKAKYEDRDARAGASSADISQRLYGRRNKETAASVGSERGVVELSNSSALCCVMYHGGSQQ